MILRRKAAALRLLALVSLLVLGAAACGGSAPEDASGLEALDGVVPRAAVGLQQDAGASPLRVGSLPTPPFAVRNYETSGRYPEVSGSRLDLAAVNDALLGAVLADQERFAPRGRRYADFPPGSGVYATAGGRYTPAGPGLISASTAVVSVLLPVTRLFPGGNDGSDWIAVTVEVPSGAPVRIADLFADPAEGLEALAAAARSQLLATSSCVRGATVEEGFRPTARAFRRFALLPEGLAVGFPNGQVAPPYCNRVHTVVPYSVVAPYLSERGERLIAGARPPRP